MWAKPPDAMSGPRPFLQLSLPAKAQNQTRVTQTGLVALGVWRDQHFTLGLIGGMVSVCPTFLSAPDVDLSGCWEDAEFLPELLLKAEAPPKFRETAPSCGRA